MEVKNYDSVPRLQHAILLYGLGNYQGAKFATVHFVEDDGKGKPVIMPGVPATKLGLKTALRELVDDRVTPELLPEHVLAKGSDYIVWYRKPTRQNVWVRAEAVGGERMAEVPVPGLVWCVDPTGKCSVFAYRGNGRPDGQTILHQAPFFNVWDQTIGNICVGNTKVPKGPAALQPENWEKMFFESWSTHPNTNRMIRGKENAYAFWKRLLDGEFKVFPQSKLYPTKLTLQKVFADMFIKGRK